MQKTVAVLGGYGLIGAACIAALKAADFRVIGIGRSAQAAQRVDGQIDWLIRDISKTTADEWADLLAGVDVVVNASGALQDGLRDDLDAIHVGAVRALVAGLAGRQTRIIQISAPGVADDASTPFLRSKMQGDRAVMQSGGDWVVLRPTLVLGRAAYGGTALLRASAALPFGTTFLRDRPVQTVFLDDLAGAVVQCAQGVIARGTVADITADERHSFGDLTSAMRAWLGFAPWRVIVPVPRVAMRVVTAVADWAGWLGWRSPLRSTSVQVLTDGMHADAGPWHTAGGTPMRGLSQTFAAMPATLQDRWFARLYLLFPLAVGTLAVFWLISGSIGFMYQSDAIATLTARGWAQAPAQLSVLGGSVADITLGLAVVWRRWTRRACLGMVGLSAMYLAAGTIWTPDIWADPLGPFVKVIPGMMLALIVASLTEDR